jgi:hypothetical protein
MLILLTTPPFTNRRETSMEILFILISTIAVFVWLKTKFPDSTISKLIDSILMKPQSSHQVTASSEVTTNSLIDESPINIPEDSILRRHYLTQIQAELDAKSASLNTSTEGAKPIPIKIIPEDSVLRRHYLTEWEANYANS